MTSPSEVTTRLASPRSIADLAVADRQRRGRAFHHERGVVPAVRFLITVTDDGTDGRSRDHSTLMSPTFATYSRSPCRANPLRVSRTDWRPCLRRGVGCLIFGPLRRPASESNQFLYARRASWHACTSATDATSPSQARSGVSLASVITRRCTSVSEIFSPAAWQASRSRRQSLYTTRAQPNTRARACCCPGAG